jgi:hypothetical protein
MRAASLGGRNVSEVTTIKSLAAQGFIVFKMGKPRLTPAGKLHFNGNKEAREELVGLIMAEMFLGKEEQAYGVQLVGRSTTRV